MKGQRATAPVAFVPDEFQPQRYGAFATRRIYGVEFTRAGRRALWNAIKEQTGELDAMGEFVLHLQVRDQVRDKHHMVDAYIDDIDVQICIDLGIDYRQFEHNVPKLPTDGFVALAKTKLASLPLPSNQTQWMLQRKRWTSLWFGWVADECARRNCDSECGHHSCEELYRRPNFWSIALEIEDDRQEKTKLLASVDAKPRAKAVKAANDALARISARARA